MVKVGPRTRSRFASAWAHPPRLTKSRSLQEILFGVTLICVLAGATLPAYALEPSVGQWVEVPNSRLDAVLPSPLPDVGYGAPRAIMSAWSGGTYDTTRDQLLVWGGGHADYGGNEVYAFSLTTRQWSRLTNPSPTTRDTVEALADGRPASRHTYAGLTYLPVQQRLFAVGGSLWFGGNGSRGAWMFDPGARIWLRRADMPGHQLTSMSAYDPIEGVVYSLLQNGVLAAYDPVSNQWTERGGTGAWAGYDPARTMVLHPTKRVLLVVGGGEVFKFDLTQTPIGAKVIPTTGGDPVLGLQGPGLAYDPVLDKIVGWDGGADLYSLDVDSGVWTRHAAIGSVAPPPPPHQGTYGRFQYVASANVYIVVNAINQNVFLFRLTDGTPPPDPGPTPPPSPSSPPVISTIALSLDSATQATITWTTEKPASGAIDYGFTTSYGQTELASGVDTSQSVTLRALSARTTYHARVRATDTAKSTGVSSDLQFTTPDQLTPPGAAADVRLILRRSRVTYRLHESKRAAEDIVITRKPGVTVAVVDTVPPLADDKVTVVLKRGLTHRVERSRTQAESVVLETRPGLTVSVATAETPPTPVPPPAAGAGLSVSPNTVTPGMSVSVQIVNGPAGTRDWVGLFVAGAPGGAFLDWKYLSGSQTPPTVGVSSAALSFPAPTVAGSFEVRLYADDSLSLLASAPLSVTGTMATPPPPPPSPAPAPISLPVRTWVARPLPGYGQGPMPSGGKHSRLLYDAARGRMVLTGGDYATPDGHGNGNAKVWAIDLSQGDAWTLLAPECLPAGIQPGGPDNVGWVYDVRRDEGVMLPGFYFLTQGGTMCASTPPGATANAVRFAFGTNAWQAPTWPAPPGGYGGDLGSTYAVSDATTDAVYRFRWDGAWGNQMEILHRATNTWEVLRLGATDPGVRNTNTHSDQSAIDEAGRHIYVISRPLRALLKYSIPARTVVAKIPLPSQWVSPPGGGHETWMTFDPIHRVLLIPYVGLSGYTGLVEALAIYHVDTGQWEWEPVTGPVAGQTVRGNVVGFDAIHNALMLIGGHDATVFWLYRYGNAE